MKRAILAIGLLTLLVCSAYAQDTITAKIPFDFVAAGKTLPAGSYQFRPLNEYTTIEVRNLDTGKATLVNVQTRLAISDFGVAQVSFDKVGEKMVLETVSPGNDDGYLLSLTKEKHTHRIIKAG